MKHVAAGLAMLAACAVASPAGAAVIEISTSVAVADAEDQDVVRAAVQRAVDELVKDAASFTPTLVVLTRSVVIGGRLYLRVLLADESGEKSLRDLTAPADAPAPPSNPPASPRTDI